MIYRPSHTNNGWWPNLSADGRWVVYGNQHACCTNLDTQETHEYPGGHASGWISHDTFSFIRFTSNITAERYEVRVGDWSERRVEWESAFLLGGYDISITDGHWAVSKSGLSVAYDKRSIEEVRVWNARVAGPYLAFD